MSLSSNDETEHLIAGLNSARESMAALDLANKELIEALESSQEEIARLSAAGKNLQNKYRQQTEKLKSVEDLNKSLSNEIQFLKEKYLSPTNANDLSDKIRISSENNFELLAQIEILSKDLLGLKDIESKYNLQSEKLENLEKVNYSIN
jgi:chromosome segregation ATPase